MDSEEVSAKYELCLRLYKDIINGYSVAIDETKEVYIKHLKDVDYAFFEQKKDLFKMEAEKAGLQSEEELLALLHESGNWSKEEEANYQVIDKELRNLRKTHSKIFLDSQRKIIAQRIKEKQQKVLEAQAIRGSLNIKSSQEMAAAKLNDYIMTICLYKDPALREPLFTHDEFRELDVDTLTMYNTIYYASLSNLRADNLRRVGHCGLFLNSFMLCDASPYHFFGIRGADLTSYQGIIASHGCSCKNILENSDNTMPDYDDIDDVCEWFKREAEIINKKYSPKSKSTKSSPNTGSPKQERFEGIAVVGANQDEMLALAQEKDATPVDFHKAAEKLKKDLKKDVLNSRDILTIHD